MIDVQRRKKLAYHMRHLSIGLINNDQFEERILNDVSYGQLPEQYFRSYQAKFDDPIIVPILELCWSLYDDTRQHKLNRGNELTKESLELMARCILFLHSNREYEWPYFDVKSVIYNFSLLDYVFTLITFGYHFTRKHSKLMQSFKEFQKLGDYTFWPFFRESDYVNQLNKRPFLNPPKLKTA